jgi:hypothetical protein
VSATLLPVLSDVMLEDGGQVKMNHMISGGRYYPERLISGTTPIFQQSALPG